MALNNDAIFTASVGFVYAGTPGTATRPTQAQIAAFDASAASPVLGTGWTDLGHTSREDLPEFGFEGGEIETRGTWRSAALREVTTEVAVDYVVVRLHQFDEEGLSLYYGQDNTSILPGEFAVSGAVLRSTERALCIVIVDGDNKIAFYAPRASIRREEELTMAVDEFAVLPLRATFLDPEATDTMGNGSRFAWVSGVEGLINVEAETP